MFEVRWNSLRPQGHSSGNTATLSQISFVLRIEIINCEHAIVEAWMEADAARRTVLERQPRRIEVSCDDRYLHVEVVDDHADESAAIASMTVARGMNDGASDRLVYVHTSLLRQAGFSAGTCERAALVRQSVAEVEKVSA